MLGHFFPLLLLVLVQLHWLASFSQEPWLALAGAEQAQPERVQMLRAQLA